MVDKEPKKGRLKTLMLLHFHDELVFKVLEKEAENIKRLVHDDMKSVMQLDVPLVVNISVGDNLSKV